MMKRQLPNLAKNTQNFNEKTCNLKFSKCDNNKYQLWDLTKDELKKFVSFAKKLKMLHGVKYNKAEAIIMKI